MRAPLKALNIVAMLVAAFWMLPAGAQDKAPATQQERMKSCSAQAKADSLKGDARKSFMSDCLAGKTAAGTPPPPAKAQTAPATTATTQPAKKAAPSAPATATALAAGQFASASEAGLHCPSDQVVWANTDSRIYHYAGNKAYGHTKQGAYMCQKESDRAGFRAAKNEKAPG